MYPVHSFLKMIQSTLPDATEEDAERIFRWAVRDYANKMAGTEGHLAHCLCPDCDWVAPLNKAQRWHGTMTGYGYHKCRCERCRRAARQYNKGRR